MAELSIGAETPDKLNQAPTDRRPPHRVRGQDLVALLGRGAP